MHTDTTPKEKPTGDGNPTAGHTDSLMVPNPASAIKAVLIRSAEWLALISRGLT
jgi:hypothetical protein